jgi:hypothetical protein
VSLDPATLLAAYDSEVRFNEARNVPPTERFEIDDPLYRVVGGYRGFVSGPVDLGVDGADLDELIGRQCAYFAEHGQAFEWKVRAHDRPADLVEHLLAAGFVPEPSETVLIGLAEELAEQAPRLPEGVVVRQVESPLDARRVAAMESEVWGEDRSWLGDDLAERIAAGMTDVFVAEAGEKVVSAGWVHYLAGTEFAGLFGGSTLAAWRGKGIYRALVARRAFQVIPRGVRYLQVDASDESRPILERLGLVAVTTTTPYVFTPPSAGGRGGS